MIHGGRIAFEIARLNRKASNTDASQLCLGKPGVCRLGCVEFIYTSVSRNDTLSLVTTATEWLRVTDQVNAAMIKARAHIVNVHYGESCLCRRRPLLRTAARVQSPTAMTDAIKISRANRSKRSVQLFLIRKTSPSLPLLA